VGTLALANQASQAEPQEFIEVLMEGTEDAGLPANDLPQHEKHKKNRESNSHEEN